MKAKIIEITEVEAMIRVLRHEIIAVFLIVMGIISAIIIKIELFTGISFYLMEVVLILCFLGAMSIMLIIAWNKTNIRALNILDYPAKYVLKKPENQNDK